MKGTAAVLTHFKGRKLAALFVDGQLQDLMLDSSMPATGTIYRATIDRIIKGSGGLFVKLPDGQRGFVRNAKGYTPGSSILVQVTGFAEDGKAVPVTPKIMFKSRFVIVTADAPGRNVSRSIKDEEERARLKTIAHEFELPPGCGLIIRSHAADASDDAVADDISEMTTIAGAVLADTGTDVVTLLDGPDVHMRAWAEWPKPDVTDNSDEAFDAFDLADHLDALSSPVVKLGAAHAYIEPTRAMVAVDVNTGADGSLAAGLKANIALARDLPRQLRCRGLGGQITLDLAPMPKKDRRAWEQILKSAFRADSIDTALAGWTPLGNFELQRKRERLPLAQIMAEL